MSHRAVIQTDVAGTITSWNDDARVLLGHAADAVVGRPVDVVIPPAFRDAHWAGFHRAMADPRVRDMAADMPLLCADGQVREYAGRLLVLSDGLGTALGAIAIYTDADSTGFRPFTSDPSSG